MIKKIKLNNSRYLSNRIVVSPMCQYSSIKGNPVNWHYKHLNNLAHSGAALLMIEATAVEERGKITHSDMSIINNDNYKNLKKLVNYLKKLLENKGFFVPFEKKHSMIMNINNLFYRLEPNDKELRILASIISSLSKKNINHN